jgi:putative ABC transport system permease protein
VVAISLEQDIRQYGQLKVLGTTNRQLARIVYRQKLKSIAVGLILGAVVGAVLVKIFMPLVTKMLYMQGLGNSDVSAFYPLYLGLSLVAVFIISFLATSIALRKVMKWEAVDALRYTVRDKMTRKNVQTAKHFGSARFAWRNISHSKKRLFVTMFIILLAGITSLSAVVITTGTSQENKEKMRADFSVNYFWSFPQHYDDKSELIPPSMVKEAFNTEGVIKRRSYAVAGSFAMIDYDQDAALQPAKKAMENYQPADGSPYDGKLSKARDHATLQIISDDYLKKLEDYATKKKLTKINFDIERLKNGEGVVLLHKKMFSQKLLEASDANIGKAIHFYSLGAYQKDDISSYGVGKLSYAGLIDWTDDYMPFNAGGTKTDKINYFLMTEKAFKKLNLPKKYFAVEINAEPSKQAITNQLLAQIVQKENRRVGKMRDEPEVPETFEKNSFADYYAGIKGQIQAKNWMMLSVCFIILLIAVMNFVNTILSSFASRSREFTILESLGQTKKQLRKLLFMEGFYYWAIFMTGLLTVGSGVIWLIGRKLAEKHPYFKFIYPWQTILILAVLMLAVCLILAEIMYLRNQKLTLTERLKMTVD